MDNQDPFNWESPFREEPDEFEYPDGFQSFLDQIGLSRSLPDFTNPEYDSELSIFSDLDQHFNAERQPSASEHQPPTAELDGDSELSRFSDLDKHFNAECQLPASEHQPPTAELDGDSELSRFSDVDQHFNAECQLPASEHQPPTAEQDNLFCRCRSAKRKITLSSKAEELKSAYYATFTTRKSFQKCYMYEIHQQILVPLLKLPKMTRNERRQKDLYFQKYAPIKDALLNCLKLNKNYILKNILKNIKNKKISNKC